MMEILSEDDQLTLEFGYTTWEDSCQDPSPTMHECRRRRRHDGDHAAGFGASRQRWGN